MAEEERHSREGYWIVGEGMAGAPPPAPGTLTAQAHEDELHAFRFSRQGPRGAQLGDANRRLIAHAMTIDGTQPKRDSAIPAGYTYLGQFLDHDLTFDKSALGDSANVSVAELVDGRSPSLDLDSLYGRGPQDSPEFYADDKIHLHRGKTVPSFPADGIADKEQIGFDLPRRANGKALIPDPRNDENLVVAQTQNAFIRFHNRVVDTLAADGVPAGQLFARARETVVRHYQWMVRSDFLPRIVRAAIVTDVFTNGRKVIETAPAAGEPPTMPVEFSVGAYRLGHSMVRAAYDWNRVFDDGGGTLDLLFEFTGTSGGLGGGTRLPTNWIADFRRLYDFREAGRNDLRPLVGGRLKLNVARRIDTLLSDPLANLPPGSIGNPEPKAIRRNLAYRNLTRARMLRLATGQDMAALIQSKGVALTPLTSTQIIEGRGGAVLTALDPTQRAALARDTPLWFYALREAEFKSGVLSGVGGRIVAETFHRAIEGSTISILADPTWHPTLGPDASTFRMVDLLLFAFEGKAALLNPLGS
jgi:hypothetical protein